MVMDNDGDPMTTCVLFNCCDCNSLPGKDGKKKSNKKKKGSKKKDKQSKVPLSPSLLLLLLFPLL